MENIGTLLKRPADTKHKDFMLMQKSEWTEFHRVKLGACKWLWKWETYTKTKEIEQWCNENCKGRWFHSDGYEVYYFEDRNSAIYFKLKWFSELTDK